jgi:hypothetical protein
MRKLTAVGVIVSLSALIVSGPAAARDGTKRVERMAKGTYQTPAPAAHFTQPPHPFATTVCNRNGALGDSRGCVEFPVRPSERFVDIEIRDASGLPVLGFVQEGEAEAQDKWDSFCGTTSDLQIKPGVTIFVFVYAYTPVGLPPCGGPATAGEVVATFSKGR